MYRTHLTHTALILHLCQSISISSTFAFHSNHIIHQKQWNTNQNSPLLFPSKATCCYDTKNDNICTKTTQKDQISFSNNQIPSRSSLTGIIFDMDGTLLHPCIDFASMRRQIYEIANNDEFDESFMKKPISSGCVLELYQYLSPTGQKLADEVFRDIEADALQNMTFMEGMVSLMTYLDSLGIKRAVLTRNVESSLDYMQDKLWKEESITPFFPAVARDTTARAPGELERFLIPKPDPDSIFYICRQWGCEPKDVIMVGDSAADDIVCANRAGCASVLLKYKGGNWDNDSGNKDESIKEEMIPTVTIERLDDLKQLLINHE